MANNFTIADKNGAAVVIRSTDDGGGNQIGNFRVTDATAANFMPTMDAVARKGFVSITDGTNTMPTLDTVGRKGFVSVTDGTNTMPTMDTVARKGFFSLTDGTNAVTLAQFHNTDNQSLGGSAWGLTVGGVTQILNTAGNLDRQRETGQDGVPALGITTGAAQFKEVFTTTDAENKVAGAAVVFTPAAMSGSINSVSWSIQAGSVLVIDPGTFTVTLGAQASGTFTLSLNGQTTATINFNDTGATVQTRLRAISSIGGTNATVTGGAGGPYTVRLASSLAGLMAGLTGNFASLATPANASITALKEAVVVASVTGTTFTAKTATNHDGTTVAIGIVGNVYNEERDAAGELDGASGSGTAVALEYEFNGGAVGGANNYDRTRNLQGKGKGTQGSLTPAVGDTTLAIATPTGIQPGTQIQLSGSGTTEVTYVTTGYTVGSTTVPISPPVVNASQTTAKWSKFSETGPGLNTFLCDGEGLEVAGIFDSTSGEYTLMRSASGDGLAAANTPVETPGLFNGAALATSIDRARSGSAINLALKSSAGSELTSAPGEWSAPGTPTPGAAAQATVSQSAGGAGVRHVCRSISATLATGSTAQAAAAILNLRDGATGAGSILWSKQVILPANGVWEVDLTGLNIIGTANTAMTLEFAAAGVAGSFESVAMTGYDAS